MWREWPKPGSGACCGPFMRSCSTDPASAAKAHSFAVCSPVGGRWIWNGPPTSRDSSISTAAGHLVLGTMDTPDAAATLAALGAMGGTAGPDAALLASTLTLVTAQRLLRRPCRDCARPAGDGKEDGAKFEKGSGCATCDQSGYKGRTAAYEIMPITPALAALLKEKAAVPAIHAQAVKEGMRSMRDAALAKMRQGLTTMAEVRTL